MIFFFLWDLGSSWFTDLRARVSVVKRTTLMKLKPRCLCFSTLIKSQQLSVTTVKVHIKAYWYLSNSITIIPYFKILRGDCVSIFLLKKVSQSITDIYLTYVSGFLWPITPGSPLVLGFCRLFSLGPVWLLLAYIFQWPILLCSTVDHLLKNEFIGGQDNAGKVVNVTVTTGQLFRSTTSLAWLIPKRYYLELCFKWQCH